MKELSVITHSAEETYRLGEKLGGYLPPHTVLALYGDLAAGKTCFACGLCTARGFTQGFASPSFTVINEYRGARGTACHIDAYRIVDSEELLYTGYYDCLAEADLTVIEWADIIDSELPAERIDVLMEKTANDGERRLTFRAPDGALAACIAEMEK